MAACSEWGWEELKNEDLSELGEKQKPEIRSQEENAFPHSGRNA